MMSIKKFVCVFITLVVSICSFAQDLEVYSNDTLKQKLNGCWQIENVQYTFTNDSLYIDELNNEGDGYTYKITDTIVTAENEMIGLLKFNVVFVTDSRLRIHFYDAIPTEFTEFTLTKVE